MFKRKRPAAVGLSRIERFKARIDASESRKGTMPEIQGSGTRAKSAAQTLSEQETLREMRKMFLLRNKKQ